MNPAEVLVGIALSHPAASYGLKKSHFLLTQLRFRGVGQEMRRCYINFLQPVFSLALSLDRW
ncbi:hypothetical protein Cflav_PD5619 [Pedosphaera parvula Ellin514]|uniref:Uncharacterized protein n=1 Tax=Pedosphaera parvula (strain Ellin514) TaxID=320771 RepID=B9XAE9_PEDPL|nr:hypothetical protein Cflav_PD5619 [Pedosphaera parvula Ellin514]